MSDARDVCPRCGPTILTHVMPTLDGTPVLMCCICHRIDTEDTWKERAQ